jgi:type IV pilus assembly protein PilY1
MKRLALLLCLGLLCLQAPLAQADDDQIFSANIKPNIMLFLDTSGSMDWLVPNGGTAAAYDKNTQYARPASTSPYYQYCANGSTKVQCDNTILSDAADVYSLFGVRQYQCIDGCTSRAPSAARTALRNTGRYDTATVHLRTGNYFNYMLSQQAAKKKIDIAKDIVKGLIDGFDGIRLGLAAYKGNDQNFGDDDADPIRPGAKIVQEILTIDETSDKTALKATVDTITAVGSTPMGAALRDLGKYYAGTLSRPSGGTYASPVESGVAACQPNYIIFMSDGLPNDGSYSWNIPTPGHDPYDFVGGSLTGTPVVAPWVATNLKAQNPPATHVLIHTVGFAIPADDALLANATLTTIATNGGGQFYSAGNEAELQQAIENAILRIFSATFCFASPVVPTTSATSIDRAYLASFKSDPSNAFWEGHVKAYQRTNGVVPVDPVTKRPLDSALIWDAGDTLKLQSASTRKVYTYIGSPASLQEFKTGTSDITAASLDVPSGERDALINFIRGEGRSEKLGDIYHSTPVLVTPPFLPSTDASYVAFRAAKKLRASFLLAGANDGMLHAFQESDGAELWAFIPPNLLNKLKHLRSNAIGHTYYVDSSPIAADVKIQLSGDTEPKWRTIVIFGQRRGGNAYYCLDVTDPNDPKFLWEFTDPEIVETWSEPIIGKVKLDSSASRPENTAYVAFVGGGYTPGEDNAAGRGVFAIDIAAGAKIWEYKTKRTEAYTPTCPASSPYATDDRECMNYSIASNPLALDLNNDGFIDHIYIGDIAGQLWKFVTKNAATLSGGTTGTVSTSVPTGADPGKCEAGKWCAKRLFAAPSGGPNPPDDGVWEPQQAIYYSPVAAFDNAVPKNLWLYFGTGDRNHPNADTGHKNRFYGIKDPSPDGVVNGSPIVQANLADVSSGNATDTDGWFFRLDTKEKVLAQAEVFNSIVFFNTFTPTTEPGCDTGGGIAEQYAIQMLTGYGAIQSWDADGHVNKYTTGDIVNVRSREIGKGIPSKPMVVITESGATISTSIIQATTDQQLPNNPVPPPDTMRAILLWREVFN